MVYDVTTWAVYDDSLRVYVNGSCVAKIVKNDFLHLIAELSKKMRYSTPSVDEDLYRRCLESVAPNENKEMLNRTKQCRDINHPKHTSVFDRHEDIIEAVKKIGLATTNDIALETKIHPRAVQGAIGTLVRKRRLVRSPTKHKNDIKYYRLPSAT